MGIPDRSIIICSLIGFDQFNLMYVLTFSDNSILDECSLDDETRSVLLSQIQRKLQSQAVKVRADIEVYCYEYEGIDAVKSALKEGIKLSTDEIPIKINLISPPLYGQ